MGNFVSLHTSLTALRASQTGLDTASHNVANAHTPGYTRQRLELRANAPHQTTIGLLGAGVDVAQITRSRDDFLDRRVRGAAADAAHQGTRAELLGRTEAILAEPDQGVSGELTALWDAFEDLSLEPSEPAGRQQVLAALGSLTSRVRAVDAGWDALAADTADGAAQTVREANDLLARVAKLNADIPVASVRGTAPNDLMDERDLVADKLAALIGATAAVGADGTMTVTAGGVDLVDGVVATPLALGPGPAHAVTAGGAAVDPGGRLGGRVAFLTGDLAAHRTALDDLAADLTAELNTRHAAGFDADGTPGGALLTYDPAVGAGSLDVAAAVATDSRKLAAAAATPVAAQDGRNARSLADLRDAAVGGTTFDGRVRRLTVALAGDVAALRRSADAAEGLQVAASGARSNVTAVSIDEELVSVVQYQRSLEAASRVMTAVDQALDVLINRTGLVGR